MNKKEETYGTKVNKAIMYSDPMLWYMINKLKIRIK